MRGTHSIGITLLFWLCGTIYTLAGTHLHIEYGLTTPRYEFEGVEQGIPRSGGALIYVSFTFCPNIAPLTLPSFSMFLRNLPIGTRQ